MIDKQQQVTINLTEYNTMTEKMELLEGIMDLLEMDWGIDDHTEDKGYPYYFIQIEEKKCEQQIKNSFSNVLNESIEKYERLYKK
jgi:hypothetical protein